MEQNFFCCRSPVLSELYNSSGLSWDKMTGLAGKEAGAAYPSLLLFLLQLCPHKDLFPMALRASFTKKFYTEWPTDSNNDVRTALSADRNRS